MEGNCTFECSEVGENGVTQSTGKFSLEFHFAEDGREGIVLFVLVLVADGAVEFLHSGRHRRLRHLQDGRNIRSAPNPVRIRSHVRRRPFPSMDRSRFIFTVPVQGSPQAFPRFTVPHFLCKFIQIQCNQNLSFQSFQLYQLFQNCNEIHLNLQFIEL